MDMRDKVEEVRQHRERLLVRQPEAIKKQHSQGKLTAYERVKQLLDPGTFYELDLWAKPSHTGFNIDNIEIPGDAVITGYGDIDSRPVYLYSQDFTLVAGTVGSVHNEKIVKVMRRAREAGVPFISIFDTGGRRIQDAVTSWNRSSYANQFYQQTMSSGVIPQISLIMGPCAAPSYSAALSDFLIMVKGTSYMFICGPRVVKAAESVDITPEELGGAKVHAKISGVVDSVADDDEDCLKKCRELLSFLPLNNQQQPPVVDTKDDPNRRDEELLNIIPSNTSKGYDMHKVIRHIVDNYHFFEIKQNWAKNMITGFARLNGQTIGVVANNPMFLAGSLDIDAADKEARFVRFCDCFNIPLVFLVDNPGYLPGIDQERKGIIRHGAKVLHAICEATVPKLTVNIRKAYGGGQPAMCNIPMGADLLVAWPTSEMGLMSPEAAVEVIFDKEIATAEDPESLRQKYFDEFKTSFGDFPYNIAAHMAVEDIINPLDTRPILIKALKVLANKKQERPWKKHGNIPL